MVCSFDRGKVPMISAPQVRPGKVTHPELKPRLVAFFPNSAQGNAAIALLTALGVPHDRLGITPPELIEGGQGMLMTIPCSDDRLLNKIESICRSMGADVRRVRR
jgi:hypothetical protein